jgi:tetratricopeptide (TPR) repeat protein
LDDDGPRGDLEHDTMRVPGRAGASVPSPHIGGNLGRYLVIDELGRGGMGVVLRAYDPKLQREVALKCIRPDLAQGDAATELMHEAQSMAQLSHPNVVSVYDVEVDGETVVLVMELVEGPTLVEWLDRDHRSWREIVDVFVGAGRGLEAAHQVGVLHRDFKPGNVLVTEDDRGKVTDFGLARIAHGRGSRAPSTEEQRPPIAPEHRESRLNQSQVMRIHLSHLPPTAPATDGQTIKGTPAYMAPEQHDNGLLTHAVDQYAFCASLWEALTGSLPFTIGRKTMAALLDAKRAGPPPWPKDIDVPRVVVDAITRGLRPDADDRWPSMTELLAALAPPAPRGRLGVVWGIAGATLVAASVTSVVMWQRQHAALCSGAREELAGVWDGDRRTRAEAAVLGTQLAYAQGVWERVGPAVDQYATRWIATHAETCEATSLRGEQSTEVMDLRMNCLRRAKVALAATTTALVAADDRTVEKAHALVKSLPPLDRCDDVEALQAEVPPPDGEADREAARAIEATLATARTQLEIGRYDVAMATIDSVADAVKQLGHGPLHTEWSLASGDAYEGLGDYEKAEVAHVDALRSALQWRQWRLASQAARDLAFEVGGVLQRHGEGLAFAQTSLGLARGLGPASEAAAKSSLASIYNAQGKRAAAETELREALALWDAAAESGALGAASAHSNLAIVLASRGELEEAEQEQRISLGVYERELGPVHPSVASLRNNLAVILRNRGDDASAEAEQRRVIEVYEGALGPQHPNVASSRSNLAVTLQSRGKLAEAEVEARRAIEIYEATLGPDHADVAAARANLGGTLRAKGELVEAETMIRRALAIWERALTADHPNIAFGWQGLGSVLMDQARFTEAADAFARAHRIREAGEVAPTLRAESAVSLARALWHAPAERPRARQLRDAALVSLRSIGTDGDESRRELERWIAEAP